MGAVQKSQTTSNWTVLFTKQAQKDARKLAFASPALKQKAQALLDLLAADPYQQPPPYEALVGDLRGACSRRINIQHRLVYQVVEDVRVVKVLRMWSHYD
jgi:Txe/YoeB family toxin of toxin-antitoxin system